MQQELNRRNNYRITRFLVKIALLCALYIYISIYIFIYAVFFCIFFFLASIHKMKRDIDLFQNWITFLPRYFAIGVLQCAERNNELQGWHPSARSM